MTNTHDAIREHLAAHPFEPCFVHDDPTPLYISTDDITPGLYKGEVPPMYLKHVHPQTTPLL